ncbi:FRG domain-containing protein [Corynebacterium sp. CCM 8835]|uniref:FRG domain-containing protein n=1 Tax=Corynebacterium antarcticum TaxID=2800405 RepID=A0ABS1FLZ8_9CORY|nr:FRG domain-containing protein [Corynebacterium antarcticum]MCL0246302.1 FRG domain-containing protein [Corynebacterium antarcticum]
MNEMGNKKSASPSPLLRSDRLDGNTFDFVEKKGSLSTQVNRFLRSIGIVSFYRRSNGDSQTLWRGQSCHFPISPSAHTRILKGNIRSNDELVIKYTTDLLKKARAFGFDRLDGARLPDLPLLALLQHNLVATPLLDVTVDPLTALLMASQGVAKAEDGVLLALEAPECSIDQFDDSDFESVYTKIINTGEIFRYKAPYVTSRLRIQRGSFLIGPVRDDATSTIGLGSASPEDGKDRLKKLVGDTISEKRGRRIELLEEPLLINVPSKYKEEVDLWIRTKAELSDIYIYPEPISSRFAVEFLPENGRNSPWKLGVDGLGG